MIIKTDRYRQNMAQVLFEQLASKCEVALGSGGHNADNTVKSPSPHQTALSSEQCRIPGTVQKIDEYTVRVSALISLTIMEPQTEISEIGIFADGELLAVRNTTPTVVAPDGRFDFFSTLVLFPF